MQTLKHSRWGYTLILVALAAVLALTGGTWGTSQAAGVNSPEAVPTLTSMDPIQVKAGTSDFIMTIHGENFVDALHTGVRFYQWGTSPTPTLWEFIPATITADTITIEIPSRFVLFPNQFTVLVVNYSVSIPTPTVPPTIPIAEIPMVPYNPNVPPVIPQTKAWEEFSTTQIFTVTNRLYYLPLSLQTTIP
jgi:hypothetical protein